MCVCVWWGRETERERKRERKEREKKEKKEREKRERKERTHAGERVCEKALWLLILYVFSSTWACPMQIGLSQEIKPAPYNEPAPV